MSGTYTIVQGMSGDMFYLHLTILCSWELPYGRRGILRRPIGGLYTYTVVLSPPELLLQCNTVVILIKLKLRCWI